MCLCSSSLFESSYKISYGYLSYKILVILPFYISTEFIGFEESKILSLLFLGASELYFFSCHYNVDYP